MRELALFAGAGGGILGGQLLGWHTVCAVEFAPYPASVLCARQNDGLLPPFPIWDDVRTFDGNPWRGRVDVVSGGFPCQDISAAGKGAGLSGERSGLWSEFARIIHEVRPSHVFVENSPLLTSRGLGVVLQDLATLGFDARWRVLGASAVGAPHKRLRIWIVAHANGKPWNERWPCDTAEVQRGRDTDRSGISTPDVADAQRERGRAEILSGEIDGAKAYGPAGGVGGPGWWEFEPSVGRVANGVAARVDRLKAIGNGQVPQCAAEAWRILGGRMTTIPGREAG